MEDFVSFELAKKLKAKGFSCDTPFAMYNEIGVFHECYTSVGNMNYYDYDDFDNRDYIAPTISQVLKWLRKEKMVHISPVLWKIGWYVDILIFADNECDENVAYDIKDEYQLDDYETYEEAMFKGIEYVLDNLI